MTSPATSGGRTGPEWHFAPSFEAVLAAAQDGDDRAFGQLFEALWRRIHHFVRVRGIGDAEALVNEVFLKVFTNLAGFEGNEAQFQAWVFTIARNKLIDEARRAQRRPSETSLDTLDDDTVAGVGDVESEAMGALGDGWVAAQLAVLTPAQREVVFCRVVEDMMIEAIAEMMGKPVGAVKALQRRALRTLARALDPALAVS